MQKFQQMSYIRKLNIFIIYASNNECAMKKAIIKFYGNNYTWLSRTLVLSITSTSTFSSVSGWYLFTPTIVSKEQ